MYGIGSKKNLNMLILQILREHTDEEHSLTQQEIIKLLELNYGIECDRRSVKSNVLALMELEEEYGFEISMDKGYRLLSREFDDAELRILIDSVLFSKSISYRQAKDLIKKICKLASKHFNAKVKHVCNLPELNRTINKQAMYSMDTINDAIADRRKIDFIYNDMGTDFKLHPRRERPYVVNPYQIVANNGKFYLICNYDEYSNIAHFRIDKMSDVHMLKEKAKPMKDIKELDGRLDLPKHMAEHIYMFNGPSVPVKLATTADMMSDLVDWFGTDFQITEKHGDKIVVRVNCNENAMEYWALQYGPYVEVLQPESLRNKLRKDSSAMAEKYKK